MRESDSSLSLIASHITTCCKVATILLVTITALQKAPTTLSGTIIMQEVAKYSPSP